MCEILFESWFECLTVCVQCNKQKKPETDEFSRAQFGVDAMAAKVEGVKPTFFSTIKSRMIVEKVVENVKKSSHFSFDFIAMLIIAGMIAGGGLATDNAVSLQLFCFYLSF